MNLYRMWQPSCTSGLPPWVTVLEDELPVALSNHIELTVTSQNTDDIHESMTDQYQALNLYEWHKSHWLTAWSQRCCFSNLDSKVTNKDIRSTDTHELFKNGFHSTIHRLCYTLKNIVLVIPLKMINKVEQFIHIHMWLWIWLFHFKFYYPNKVGFQSL
jgi:hypothetical protein